MHITGMGAAAAGLVQRLKAELRQLRAEPGIPRTNPNPNPNPNSNPNPNPSPSPSPSPSPIALALALTPTPTLTLTLTIVRAPRAARSCRQSNPPSASPLPSPLLSSRPLQSPASQVRPAAPPPYQLLPQASPSPPPWAPKRLSSATQPTLP